MSRSIKSLLAPALFGALALSAAVVARPSASPTPTAKPDCCCGASCPCENCACDSSGCSAHCAGDCTSCCGGNCGACCGTNCAACCAQGGCCH
jgi:hypothetical protein